MEESSGSRVFAGRYLFEPIDDDWETGRTGFTHPAFDIQENRRVIIKRADATSPHLNQHEHSLQNEAKALEILNGLGVPKIYDVNQAVYGNHRFTYLVMEHIEGMRVEKELTSLSPVERARILLELYRLLAKAHNREISNGDIDLKHLFWLSEKDDLIVIDWGNSNIHSAQRVHQYAFDLARSAEIVFALVTQEGFVPVTGSLALPEKTKILSELSPLPEEFYRLCAWAPRNPSDDMHSPFTAMELFRVSKKWLSRLDPKYQSHDTELENLIHPQPSRWQRSQLRAIIGISTIIFAITIAVISFFLFGKNLGAEPIDLTPLSTLVTFSSTPTQIISRSTSTLIQSTETFAPAETTSPPISPSPKAYSPIIVFDNTLPINFSQNTCWTTNPTYENLSTRPSDKNWIFEIDKKSNLTDSIQTDFIKCLNEKAVAAIGLNAWIQRIGRNSEFGIFVEDDRGQRREYTLWTDPNDNTVYLRVRDGNDNQTDYTQLTIDANLEGTFPSLYYQYSVKFYLELNNQGLDILYLNPGTGLKPLDIDDLNPSQMKSVAVRSALNNVQSVGLIGRGSDIQIILWPLVFFEDAAN